MKRSAWLALLIPAIAGRAFGLDGQVAIHDPSTVVLCDGKYYTFGTSGTALVSDDGWTWRAGTRASRSGMAPDVIHIGDRYYQYIAANIGGLPRAEISMISSKSLDPNSPDYKWEEGGVVCSTDGVEDCNGIDPGAFLDPTTGRLWLTYGSYFGFIRVVELNPKNGKRLDPADKPTDISINMEATDIIHHDGWYYLFGTRGSCCRGTDSRYNIRVGRSRQVTGPYVDREGTELIKGGGTLFCGTGQRVIGPGHFGLIEESGVQKWSMHYEADLDRGGASVLDIRPLLWKEGWPLTGDNVTAGTYEVESVRTGTALELAVEGTPVGGGRGGRGRGGGGGGGGGGRGAVPDQEASAVSAGWPAGKVPARLNNYLLQAQQKWSISAAPNGGGYPGSPYFKITVAGTDRALTAAENGELEVAPAYTGAREQQWRIDQLDDGTYRIVAKPADSSAGLLALTAIGASSVTLEPFDPKGEKQRWQLKLP